MKFIASGRVTFLLASAVLHSVALAADVVPLTFINGLPFATVKIGAASTQLMIDSGGALGISLPEKTIRESGSVRLLDQKTKFSDLSGKVYEVQNFVANKVTLGTTELGPVQGRVHVQWGGAPEGPEAELTRARHAGAMGLAAFGKRPVMFDYRLGTLSVFKPGDGPKSGQPGWRALPLDFGKMGPNVNLIVNGKSLRFVLDSGAQVNLVNVKSLVAAAPEAVCQTALSDSQDCDPREIGAVQDSSGRALGKLQAERMDLDGAPFDGILGAPFFQSHKVFFDLAARRLLISPAEAKDTKLN